MGKSEILKSPIRSHETDFFKVFVVDLYNFPRENTSRNALPNAFSFLGIPTRLLDIKKNRRFAAILTKAEALLNLPIFLHGS